MASSGPNYPATASNSASYGSRAWVFPENSWTSNNIYTWCISTGFIPRTSYYLKVENFGFSIPDSTINGIEVSIDRYASFNNVILNTVDNVIKLVKGGSIVGNNLADTVTKFPTSEATKTYGGSSELWGESWTYSDINSTNFGVAYSVTNRTSDYKNYQYAYVDTIYITVYYTEGGGPSSAISKIGNVSYSNASNVSKVNKANISKIINIV